MSRLPLYKSRWFQFLIGLSVTLACLAWALVSMKSGRPWRELFAEIGAAFQLADYRTLLFLWVILAVFYWLKALRWKLLLAPVGQFDWARDLLPPIMAGFAFNNLLPMRLGELVRVVLLSRSRPVPFATALASVAVERILDALTILVLLGVGIAGFNYVDPVVGRALRTGAIVIGITSGCIVLYLIWTQHFIRVAAWCVRHVPLLPARLGERVIGILTTGSVGLEALKQGRLLTGILLASLGQWLLNALYFLCALWAFRIPLSWDGALVLAGVVAFGVAVPSVPGYFGVMQFWFLLVLRDMLFLAGEERIFAASIYYQLSQFVPVTFIGLFCANRLGFGFREAHADGMDRGAGDAAGNAVPTN